MNVFELIKLPSASWINITMQETPTVVSALPARMCLQNYFPASEYADDEEAMMSY